MRPSAILFIILFLWNCTHAQENREVNTDTVINANPMETAKSAALEEAEYLFEQFDPLTLDTTFIFSDNVKLTLKQTDSILIKEYFLDSETLDSLNKRYENSHKRVLAIERYLLRTYSDFAMRDSAGLHIKLKNGAWKLLSADTAVESPDSDHTFEYYFKDFGFYSIRVQWVEGNGYELVNHTDGSTTQLFGRPYFSPNGRFVISVNTDLMARYSSNGFQLFRNENGKLEYLGDYEPDSWGPYSAKWIDNNTLILKNYTLEFRKGRWGHLDFYAELQILTP